MTKRIEMTGLRFGRLTVVSYDGYKHNQAKWRCQCDCGNETSVNGQPLRKGLVLSCGCYHKEIAIKEGQKTKKHGHGYGTRTYKAWQGMRQRCENKNANSYEYYGGSGVIVCDRWSKFENFLEDMGECPESLTLDRINPYGDYEPSNCRWADFFVQNNNKRIHWKGKNHVHA